MTQARGPEPGHTVDAGSAYPARPVAAEQLSQPDALDAGERELNLTDLVRSIWVGRSIVVMIMAVVLLAGVCYIHSATPTYTVRMTLVPAAEPSTNSLPSIAGIAGSGVSNLLSAGGFFGTTGQTQIGRFRSVLHSQALSLRLAQRYNVLPIVFPAHWDKITKSWKQPRGPIEGLKGVLKGILGFPAWKPPDSQTLADFLSKNLTISDASEGGDVFTISLRYREPHVAQQLLTLVYNEADGLLRGAARTRSDRRIDYVEKLLPTVTVAGNRDVLIQLLAEEQRNMMLVQADEHYAADVLDPAYVPREPSWPQAKLLLALLAVFGTIIGLITVIAIDATVGIEQFMARVRVVAERARTRYPRATSPLLAKVLRGMNLVLAGVLLLLVTHAPKRSAKGQSRRRTGSLAQSANKEQRRTGA